MRAITLILTSPLLADTEYAQATGTYSVESGPRYQLRSSPTRVLCRCLLDVRQKSENEGRLDFQAQLDQTFPTEKEALWSVRIEMGPVYTVGRIEFRGNHSIGESTLRRTLLLDEGALFQADRLRRSLTRLNRTGYFEPVSAADVELTRHPREGTADITIWLKERPLGSWSVSGPVGSVRMGGPLEARLAARLGAWYATVGVAAFSSPAMRLFAKRRVVLPFFAFKRPYSPSQPWRSGFTLSPQLGPREALISFGTAHLRAAVEADSPVSPTLTVTSTFGALMKCEPAHPRWRWLRTAGAYAVDWMTASF